MNGSMKDDLTWQGWWKSLAACPSHVCAPTRGPVSKMCPRMMTETMNGVKERKWNAETAAAFEKVIRCRTAGVTKARDVKNHMLRRMESWKDGKCKMLAETALRSMEAGPSKRRGNTTPEQRSKICHAKILRGDVRGAVRHTTDGDTGGVLLPADRDEKSGDPISEALSSKHPDARVTDPATLRQHEELPDFADLDITNQVVETAAGKLSGAAGLGSDDGCSLKDLLLRFGKPSADCRKAAASLACWLSNGTPPWAACRAFLVCRALGVDHRWELPVGNYPGNSGNYHYPFFWIIFMVILHDFIFKKLPRKSVRLLPFFS